MTQAPLVTIGMPAFNHEKYVAAAIESVLAQTMQDFELIVVDDGSTDRTAEIVAGFNDPRITLIRLPYNQGPSVASAEYFKRARGSWISPLPSDDVYAPTRLEEQLAYAATHPQVGAVMTEYQFIDEAGLPLTSGHFATSLFDYKDRRRHEMLRYCFDVGNPIPAAAIMFRREWVEKVGVTDTRLLQLQDFDLYIRFALAGCEFGYVHKPLTSYRIRAHEANLSGGTITTYRRGMFELAHVLKRFLSVTDTQELSMIFPQLSPPALTASQTPVWIAHQLALRAWHTRSPAHRHFALSTWFDLFGDEEQAAWLRQWQFPIKTFYEYMAQNPLACTMSRTLQYRAYQWLRRLLPPLLQCRLRALAKRWMQGKSR